MTTDLTFGVNVCKNYVRRQKYSAGDIFFLDLCKNTAISSSSSECYVIGKSRRGLILASPIRLSIVFRIKLSDQGVPRT